MITFAILVPNHRLKIIVTRRRRSRGEKSFLDLLKIVKNIKQGSRLSRFCRHVFEQKRIKAMLGGNLAILVLFASLFSPKVSALTNNQTEINLLPAADIALITHNAAIRMPLEQTIITQRFSFFHPALDLDGQTGDPVFPIMEGTVEGIFFDRFDLGNHLIINHGSGLKSVYAHLSKIEVKVGDKVGLKTEIGQVGATGRSFGDHLHLEVFDNGNRLNPLSILPLNN